MKKHSKSTGERGSALLIVFVFAAAVAIMLYMEMPVAVFEAQRNKEQLLIDRGNEYAHAAKLYLRKVGQYPPTIDAMENTNRMRFLRKRYKDPFTGKDDWRLLHAAPNGMLTDSKVNPINNNVTGAGNSNLNANNTSAGNSSPFGGSNSASSNSPFGGSNSPSSSSIFSGFNSSNSNSTGANSAEVVVPAIPQRRPAIAANGAVNQDLSNGPLGPGAPLPMDNASFNAGSPPVPAVGSAGPNAPTNAIQTAANGQVPNQNPTTPQTPGTNPAGAAPGASPFRSSPFSTGSSSSSSGLGVMQGGGGVGIAGVASKAEGHSIKTVNDQENYSLWEFYYDPSKDAMRSAAGALAQMGGGQQTGTGQPSNTGFNSGTNSTSGFGNFGGGLSGTQNSPRGGFGQQGSTNSGFGQQGGANSGFGGFGNSGTSTPNSFGNSPAGASSGTSTNPPQQ